MNYNLIKILKALKIKFFQMIKCSKCGETDITKFWKRTKSKTGYNSWCKECCKISARVSNKTNKDIIKGVIRNSILIENKILKAENKKICCKCKEIFTFKKNSECRCKKCESEKFKLYRIKNLNRELERQKAYREKKKNAKQDMHKV